MRIHDLLDAALAKHFAWSFAWPWEIPSFEDRLRAAAARPPDPSEEDTAPDSGPKAPAADAPAQNALALPAEPRAADARSNRARATCRAFALAVNGAWAVEDREASLLATKRLLARADRLGVEIIEMQEQPVEAIRLLRLFVRHGPRLSRRQRERAAAVASLVPTDHADAIELAVEMAAMGDRAMSSALLSDEAWVPWTFDVAGLVTRLANVVDAGPTHVARRVAIDLLARIEPREGATAALRRALSLPSFSVRARALHALAMARPAAIAAADIVHVLRDLVVHPPPDLLEGEDDGDDERLVADAILVGLATVRVPEAEEALLDLIDAELETLWLDAAWATEALAVAFPKTAAAMVDHWLLCARSSERTRALAALKRLPHDLAEPRLKLAVSDPSFAVRDPARGEWLARYQSVCPVHVPDLAGAGLLAEPPSERFLARLAVMQGRLPQARLAMGRALLLEAPSREALVLLLQLVGDDSDSGEPITGPRANPAWAEAIVERFGVLGVEGLCALAARFPEPETFGWMRRLGDLLERTGIAGADAGSLRALAARHVASSDALRVDDAIRILAKLGAPPDLLERVMAVALENGFGASEARGLVVRWPDRSVDARLASEMALALAEREWPRLQYAASIALERGAPAAQVIAQRVLEVAETLPEALDAAVECARRLRAANLVGDEWALAALADPESAAFAVAARAWPPGPALRPVLEAALRSPARKGASAVVAALALLGADPPMSPRDKRLAAVLAGADEQDRAELVHALCVRGAPIGLVGPHLESLLASADRDVTGSLLGIGVWLRTPKGRALLRAVLPRIVDPDLRSDIEETLGAAHARYWAEG
jgi:hypothetical protein